MMLQLKILWRSCDCNTFNINSFIMMIILIAVLGFISCLAAENVNNFESMLANIKLMQANGRYFSYEDMINFAETCISNQISVQDLKLMAPVKHSGRYLADDNSFHCASFKAVNSANATASDLPDCLISNVLPGTTVQISDCSSSCFGDQYLRLFEYNTDIELLSNDDGMQNIENVNLIIIYHVIIKASVKHLRNYVQAYSTQILTQQVNHYY